MDPEELVAVVTELSDRRMGAEVRRSVEIEARLHLALARIGELEDELAKATAAAKGRRS